MRKKFLPIGVLLIVVSALFGFWYYLKILKGPCTTIWGNREETGAMSEGLLGNDYLQYIDTKYCFLGFRDQKDPLFPDSSIRLEIGLFDRQGNLKRYQARIGGEDFDNKPVDVGICEFHVDKNQCGSEDVQTAAKRLKKGSIARGNLVIRDDAPWANSEVAARNSEFLENLRGALLEGGELPDFPEDPEFAIQIWELSFSKK